MSKIAKNNSNPATDVNQELFADTNVTMKTGHLVKDAEIIGNGKFVKIRIASNKQYKTPEGEIETKTDYFNALVSSNLKDTFETAKGLEKGDWVYLKGEDSTQSFDTPEGFKQTASTIFAYKVALKKKKGNGASVHKPENEPSAI